MNKLILLLLLAPVLSDAQPDKEFAAIDRRARQVNSSSLPALAAQLTAPYKRESDKVRSVFMWITSHIAYDVSIFRNPLPDDGFVRNDSCTEEDNMWLYDQTVSRKVLKEHKAICYGYAHLFKTLCDYAGIGSAVVEGYAKSGIRLEEKPMLDADHAWNAVRIDSCWYLLDATWASGGVDEALTFQKWFDPGYYLTPPETMVLNHYPHDQKWTLLDHPPARADFYNAPVIFPEYALAGIASYNPRQGILTVHAGDTIHFELAAKDTAQPLFVLEDYSYDEYMHYLDSNMAEDKREGYPSGSALPSATTGKGRKNQGSRVRAAKPAAQSQATYTPPFRVSGKTVSYDYCVGTHGVKTLQIHYNGQVLMEYALVVHRKVDPKVHRPVVLLPGSRHH